MISHDFDLLCDFENDLVDIKCSNAMYLIQTWLRCTKYKKKTLYIKGGKNTTIAVIKANIVIEYAYMNEN